MDNKDFESYDVEIKDVGQTQLENATDSTSIMLKIDTSFEVNKIIICSKSKCVSIRYVYTLYSQQHRLMISLRFPCFRSFCLIVYLLHAVFII